MTIIAFNPSPVASPPFQANVTLDGTTYSFVAMWNFYRQDWYFSLTDQTGNLIVNQPLIGSPTDTDIPLAPGMFTNSKLVYRVNTGNLEITP